MHHLTFVQTDSKEHAEIEIQRGAVNDDHASPELANDLKPSRRGNSAKFPPEYYGFSITDFTDFQIFCVNVFMIYNDSSF